MTERLFRVFPYLAEAETADDEGHPLFRSGVSAAGRICNPSRYQVLYCGAEPAAVVAEKFSDFRVWTPEVFESKRPAGSSYHLAIYHVGSDGRPVADLDDPAMLQRLNLKPSQVASESRAVTQSWAPTIWGQGCWSGCRWWSKFISTWSLVGLWDIEHLEVADVQLLTVDHDAVRDAARMCREAFGRDVFRAP